MILRLIMPIKIYDAFTTLWCTILLNLSKLSRIWGGRMMQLSCINFKRNLWWFELARVEWPATLQGLLQLCRQIDIHLETCKAQREHSNMSKRPNQPVIQHWLPCQSTSRGTHAAGQQLKLLNGYRGGKTLGTNKISLCTAASQITMPSNTHRNKARENSQETQDSQSAPDTEVRYEKQEPAPFNDVPSHFQISIELLVPGHNPI